MERHKERIGGIVINWITIFAQIVVSLIFVPFFLKTVGDMQFGLYSFSTSLIAWLDVLMVAVASAYYKFLTREKKNNGEYGEARACGIFWHIFLIIAVIILLFGLLFDLLLYFGIIPLHEYSIAEKNQICLIILFSVISTAVSCFLTVRKSYHYYKQKYILIYSFSLCQIILQAALSILFLKLGFGVVAVALIHFSISTFFIIVLSILSKLFLKERISIRPVSIEDKKYRKQLFVEILVFSSFVIINTVVDTMNKTLDKTILGFYNSSSVATYQLAYTIPSYLISFTSIFSIVFNQKMNDAYYNGSGKKEMDDIFLKVSKIQTIFTFLIVGGFVCCGKEFIFLWLDGSRINVYYISCILMLTYSLTCSNRLAIAGRRIQNFHIKASLIYLGIALLNIALSVLLVNLVPKDYAIWACVIGTVTTYLIGHWIIMQIYDKKITGLSIGTFFQAFLKYMFISTVVFLVIGRSVNLFIPVGTFAKFFIKGISFTLCYFLITVVLERNLLKEFKGFFIKRKNN